MYYVIQTAPGKERETKIMIEKLVSKDKFSRCFFLTRDVRKKFRGEWRTVTQRLFPGYVFIESEDVLNLYIEAYHVPMLTKFLGREKDLFLPLNPRETGWLDKLTAKGAHVPISKVGITEGDKVVFLSDPLMELEGYVKKLDLHRRIAEVEVDFLGGKRIFYLGIELVGNTVVVQGEK